MEIIPPAIILRCLVARLVVKAYQLISWEREGGVCFPGVVAEFDFVHSRPQAFHNSTDLSAQQALFGKILEESDYRQQLEFTHTAPYFYST